MKNKCKGTRFLIGLTLLSISILFSCHRKTAPGITPDPPGVISGSPAQWLYITIASAMDTTKKQTQIRVLYSQVAAGKIREKGTQPDVIRTWKILITDSRHAVLDSVIIAHPHFRDMEYQQENGQLAKKTVFTPYIEVPLRFIYTTAARQIEIVELENSKKQIKLFSQPLVL